MMTIKEYSKLPMDEKVVIMHYRGFPPSEIEKRIGVPTKEVREIVAREWREGTVRKRIVKRKELMGK